MKLLLLIGIFIVGLIVGCDHEPEANTGHAMTANEFHTQAILSLLQGDHVTVVKYCTAAIELDPDNSAFYSTRASSFEALQSWDAALADYGEMLRINPRDIMGLASRSKLYLQMGMPEQAALDDRAYAAAMTERNPHWPEEESVRKICSELDGYAPLDYEKLSTREKAIWNAACLLQRHVSFSESHRLRQETHHCRRSS